MSAKAVKPALGLDLWGTLFMERTAEGERIKTEDAVPIEGAISATRELVNLFGPKQVYIISAKKNPNSHHLSLRRLQEWRLPEQTFFMQTGLLRENVRFCDSDAEKIALCQFYGITHFVDNKPQVHDALAGFVPFKILYCPSAEYLAAYPKVIQQVRLVRSWEEAVTYIKHSVRRQ